MKQSEHLTPVQFDDSDIVVDDRLWAFLFNDNPVEPISFCTGNSDFEALFFLPNFKCDRTFKAKILHHSWSVIQVTCLQDNGTIWLEDVEALKELFMVENKDNTTDIYVTCQPIQEHDGRYIALKFNYYHTSPDLV